MERSIDKYVSRYGKLTGALEGLFAYRKAGDPVSVEKILDRIDAMLCEWDVQDEPFSNCDSSFLEDLRDDVCTTAKKEGD